MNRIGIIFLSILFVSGCSTANSNKPDITEEDAKDMVIEEHCREAGEVEIISVMNQSNKYIIKWENELIEEGIDSVHKKSGKLKMIESTRGSCEWRNK